MIGFNHGLVGGLIAKYVPWPVAVPLAFASHFVLDMLPHYGMHHHKRDNSYFWKIFFTIDALATLGLAIWAIHFHHFAMFFGGLAAVIPDFIWVAKVIKHRTFNLLHHNSAFECWHIAIQKHEYSWGIWIELPLAIILFYFVMFRTA